MDWKNEEVQKFIKRKAVYQKAGLSNVFKNRSKTKNEVTSKCAFLREVVEWTEGKVEKRQAKAELQEMEEWLKDFQKRIDSSYSTTKEKMDGPEFIWRFDPAAYEKELAIVWKEEEEERKKSQEVVATPRRSKRPKGATSRSSSAPTGDELVENSESKMADSGSQKSEERQIEDTDYQWSDVSSMTSVQEELQLVTNKKKEKKSDINQTIKSWLEEREMNETLHESKKEADEDWRKLEMDVGSLHKRVNEVEGRNSKQRMEKMVEEKLETMKKQLESEVSKKISKELQEVVKEIKTDLEGKLETKRPRKEEVKLKREEAIPKRSDPDIGSSIEKFQFQENKMDMALKGIPKFDGMEAKFHTWRKRLVDVFEKYEFLEKQSYEKFQLMMNRMTEEAVKMVKDIEELEEKPFESTLDRLDRKYLRRTQEERIVAKIKEFANISDEENEKWQKMKLFLESLEAGYTEETIKWTITVMVVLVFDRKLEERWQMYRLKKRNLDRLEVMRDFLEHVYERKLDTHKSKIEDSEKRIKCHLCGERHGLKCEAFAALSREERVEFVKDKQLCFNCLKAGHIAAECRRQACKCGERAHFRIHECKKYYSLSIKLPSSQTLTYTNIKDKLLVTMPDLGADISIIAEKTAKQLQLKRIDVVFLEVKTVAETISHWANVYEVEIKKYRVRCFEFKRMPRVEQEGIGCDIPKIENQQLDLILGNNAYPLIRHEKEEQVTGGVVIRTPVGKIFYKTDAVGMTKVNMLLNQHIKKEKKVSLEEEEMVQKLDKEIKVKETLIEAPMMLKEEVKETLCSFGQAKKRLLTQWKKMKNNKGFEEMYDEAVYAYLTENYAIEKPEEVKPLNFIPHHLVLNPNKKPRLVFACNTKGRKGKALNDVLATGIVQLNDIPQLLNKWRERRYFSIADIRAMYHQIMMLKRQYGLCAFLYWKKGTEKREDNVQIFVMTRHVFGARDSPCIAIKALEKMIQEIDVNEKEKQDLKQAFYMDDLLVTADKQEKVQKLLIKAKEGLHPQFNLTKIYSNVENIRKKYAPEVIECNRILGISYDQQKDEIRFDTKAFELKEETPNYQDLASALMKLYDPQGLMEPIRAIFKSLYSKFIKQKHQWKDTMKAEDVNEWNNAVEKYKMTKELPRYVGEIRKYAVFVDASKSRYGAAIYGMTDQEHKLLYAKSRVIPERKQSEESIPNNELNAALLGAEAVQEYCFEKSEKKVQYYSDNKSVLQFIRDQTIPVDTYKRRRIKRIIELSDKNSWQYIESENNPADLLTKAPTLKRLDRWFGWLRETANVRKIALPWRRNTSDIDEERLKEEIRREQEQLDINKIKQSMRVEKDKDGIWNVILRRTIGEQHKKVLLSNRLKVAEDIARDIHERMHIGRDAIRVQMRKRYYTIGETELAKRVYINCRTCQEEVRMPKFQYKANNPHPVQMEEKIFKNIGLDHTAALRTKSGKKVYILIVICLYSRNIKVHLVESLDAKDVELALIQLEASNGKIENIHSDNYKSFQHLQKYHKQWKFTSPYASFQGGAWERAIKAVKRTLAPYLGRSFLENEWRTLCVLAENALNNKPLNRLINDPEQEVITPSRIAQCHEWSKDTLNVSRRWRARLVRMTRRWHQQMLEEMMRQKREGCAGKEPRVGQEVLVKDEKVRRNLWRKAKVETLIASHDGEIRNVEVIDQKGKKIKRSLKDLIVLE